MTLFLPTLRNCMEKVFSVLKHFGIKDSRLCPPCELEDEEERRAQQEHLMHLYLANPMNFERFIYKCCNCNEDHRQMPMQVFREAAEVLKRILCLGYAVRDSGTTWTDEDHEAEEEKAHEIIAYSSFHFLLNLYRTSFFQGLVHVLTDVTHKKFLSELIYCVDKRGFKLIFLLETINGGLLVLAAQM